MRMIDLGVKRKDLGDGYYGCAPCCESDPAKKSAWENETVHPSLDLSGKHADMFGLADLKLGDRVKVELLLEVTSLRDNQRKGEGGKVSRDCGLGFKIIEASDLVDAGSESKGDDDDDEPQGAHQAALDAILK